jgi:hypothetical protein
VGALETQQRAAVKQQAAAKKAVDAAEAAAPALSRLRRWMVASMKLLMSVPLFSGRHDRMQF